jgi:hypothetical protein
MRGQPSLSEIAWMSDPSCRASAVQYKAARAMGKRIRAIFKMAEAGQKKRR